jgi:hypothetical protein
MRCGSQPSGNSGNDFGDGDTVQFLSRRQRTAPAKSPSRRDDNLWE